MAVLSKLLCEYIVTANVNDRLDVDAVPTSGPYTITLTAQRYRDHVALAAELQTQLNASASAVGTWTVSVANDTGIITISCDADFTVDWKTGTYGTTLRDDLGYTGGESVTGAFDLAATSTHLGGFYPLDPVELDNRPAVAGSDPWDSDAFVGESRSGMLATKGGDVRRKRRRIQLFLTQDDLSPFETWMRRAVQGFSFAFYHDRAEAWSGPSSEYSEYKLAGQGEQSSGYAPQQVDELSHVYHRQTLFLRERVGPTT